MGVFSPLPPPRLQEVWARNNSRMRMRRVKATRSKEAVIFFKFKCGEPNGRKKNIWETCMPVYVRISCKKNREEKEMLASFLCGCSCCQSSPSARNNYHPWDKWFLLQIHPAVTPPPEKKGSGSRGINRSFFGKKHDWFLVLPYPHYHKIGFTAALQLNPIPPPKKKFPTRPTHIAEHRTYRDAYRTCCILTCTTQNIVSTLHICPTMFGLCGASRFLGAMCWSGMRVYRGTLFLKTTPGSFRWEEEGRVDTRCVKKIFFFFFEIRLG